MPSDIRTLVIDDLRVVKNDDIPVTYARTPAEGKLFLQEQTWDQVFLDFDLGIDRTTGNDLTIEPVIDYIVLHAKAFAPVMFTVISSNVWGRDTINNRLGDAGLDVDMWDMQFVNKAFRYLDWNEQV